MAELPTVTSRQMLKALVKHRNDGERLKSEFNRGDLTFAAACLCGKLTPYGVDRVANYVLWAKHCIIEASKESNE